jgi:hypothetical protein
LINESNHKRATIRQIEQYSITKLCCSPVIYY